MEVYKLIIPSNGLQVTVNIKDAAARDAIANLDGISPSDVKDKDATLSWGTKTTIATIGELSIHVTLPSNPDTNVVTSVSGKTGNVTLGKSDVGLGNVTNDAQVKRTEMGAASGVATLGTDGKVPSSQLPSYVDDVIEGYMYNGKFYAESTHETLITGESGKIYSDLSTNKIYRWGGSAFAVISETLAVGTTQGTAFDGKSGYDHVNNTSNPHSVTKSQVGLGNVGNFKAVSTAASQGLDSTEQSNARANIGLGSLATKSSLAASDIPTITKSKISDFPSSMPASDVSAWAKASSKPSYSYSEISGTPSSLPASDVSSWAKAANKPSYNLDEISDGTNKKWSDIADALATAAALTELDERTGDEYQLIVSTAINDLESNLNLLSGKFSELLDYDSMAISAALNLLNKKILFLLNAIDNLRTQINN